VGGGGAAGARRGAFRGAAEADDAWRLDNRQEE